MGHFDDTGFRRWLALRFIVTLVALPLIVAAVYAADAPISSVVSSFRTDPPVQRDVLTNEGIVLLSEAGFSEYFIAQKIVRSRTRFDTSAEGLAFLGRNAISEKLVLFILDHAAQPPLPQTIAPVAAPSPRSGN